MKEKEKPKKFKAQESRQVTERTYEQYLANFSLPEEYLENRGIILDVGAGFASFAQRVNEKFGKKGTKAFALDPVYTFFEGDYEKFEAAALEAGLYPEFMYGRVETEGKSFEDIRQETRKLYDDFHKEATLSGYYIAGSHQELPFRTESVDLVVGNNSILQFNNREIMAKALDELVRVLKKEGEIRLAPTYFKWNEDQQQIALVKYGRMTLEEQREFYQGSGKLIDKIIFGKIRNLEADGVRFYLVLDRVLDSDSGKEKVLVLNLIIRKDESVPRVDIDDPDFYELRKLDFSRSTDKYFISSVVVRAENTKQNQ